MPERPWGFGCICGKTRVCTDEHKCGVCGERATAVYRGAGLVYVRCAKHPYLGWMRTDPYARMKVWPIPSG